MAKTMGRVSQRRICPLFLVKIVVHCVLFLFLEHLSPSELGRLEMIPVYLTTLL